MVLVEVSDWAVAVQVAEMANWNPVISIPMVAAIGDSDHAVEGFLHSVEVADHGVHRGASAAVEIGVVSQLTNAIHFAAQITNIAVEGVGRRAAAGALQEAGDITLQIFYRVGHLSFWTAARKIVPVDEVIDVSFHERIGGGFEAVGVMD